MAVSNADGLRQTTAAGADGVGLFPPDSLLGLDLEFVHCYVVTKDASIGAGFETRLRTSLSDF
jgi:hypothetical protein